MRIAWIGLGAMGLPMARRLLARGFSVAGYDQSDASVAAFRDAGGEPRASVPDAARDADVLAVMVATPDQARVVLFGDGTGEGAADALAPGSIVLLMATVGIAAVAELDERLGERGILLVDAPVSGGTSRAGTGDLLVMVSGDQTARDRVADVLDALAGHAPVVGDRAGDGQRMKLVNQLLCGVHIAAAAEALSLAEAMGVSPEAAWEVVRHGAAQSFMLEDRGPRMWAEDPPVRSAVDIFVKDMGLVAEASAAHGHDARLTRTAHGVYLEASGRGGGRRDDSSIIDVYRGPSGIADGE